MENRDDNSGRSGELPRTTPRVSPAGGLPTEEADNETPQANLVQLAKVVNGPITPPQQTSTSTAAASQRKSVRRTPGAGRLAPLPSKRSARSPHVVRAFEQRRAATPGRERRKSGRYPAARETPRDLLRALSRQLATTSAQYVPSPAQPTPRPAPRLSYSDRRASDVIFYSDPGHNSEDEDEELPPAPRLSMDLNEFEQAEDEEDARLPVPRYSLPLENLEDMDYTHTSIEFGRRAVTERPYRPSFGIRLSDRFADFNGVAGGSSPRTGGYEDGDEREEEDDGGIGVIGDESLASRMSVVNDGDGDVTGDITGALDGNLDLDGDEPSFFLPVPDEGGERFTQTDDRGESENGTLLNGYAHEAGGGDEEEYDLPEVISAQEAPSSTVPKPAVAIKKKRKPLPLSRHGIPYPPFPRHAIKKMATKFSGSTISVDTLDALVAASEAFFQQASEDLAAYSKHAGRKVIEDSDVVQLLRRQRQLNSQTTAFSLAQRHLPRELLQEIRMPVSKVQTRRRQWQRPSLPTVEEEDGDEVVVDE
ncbi:centromere kinetochore component CENP-T-domain-containing protein [Tuber brumale]|nr:centromere kinetochore component CENP-T-domain-containing protein [Tuber brumale]